MITQQHNILSVGLLLHKNEAEFHHLKKIVEAKEKARLKREEQKLKAEEECNEGKQNKMYEYVDVAT